MSEGRSRERLRLDRNDRRALRALAIVGMVAGAVLGVLPPPAVSCVAPEACVPPWPGAGDPLSLLFWAGAELYLGAIVVAILQLRTRPPGNAPGDVREPPARLGLAAGSLAVLGSVLAGGSSFAALGVNGTDLAVFVTAFASGALLVFVSLRTRSRSLAGRVTTEDAWDPTAGGAVALAILALIATAAVGISSVSALVPCTGICRGGFADTAQFSTGAPASVLGVAVLGSAMLFVRGVSQDRLPAAYARLSLGAGGAWLLLAAASEWLYWSGIMAKLTPWGSWAVDLPGFLGWVALAGIGAVALALAAVDFETSPAAIPPFQLPTSEGAPGGTGSGAAPPA